MACKGLGHALPAWFVPRVARHFAAIGRSFNLPAPERKGRTALKGVLSGKENWGQRRKERCPPLRRETSKRRPPPGRAITAGPPPPPSLRNVETSKRRPPAARQRTLCRVSAKERHGGEHADRRLGFSKSLRLDPVPFALVCTRISLRSKSRVSVRQPRPATT